MFTKRFQIHCLMAYIAEHLFKKLQLLVNQDVEVFSKLKDDILQQNVGKTSFSRTLSRDFRLSEWNENQTGEIKLLTDKYDKTLETYLSNQTSLNTLDSKEDQNEAYLEIFETLFDEDLLLLE